MSTEQELKALMGLVGALAQDTALYMGNVVQINKVETSAEVLEDRLRALLAELDAAREDAARYRWLRQEAAGKPSPKISVGIWGVNGNSHCGKIGATPEEVDAAIDAARKGEA